MAKRRRWPTLLLIAALCSAGILALAAIGHFALRGTRREFPASSDSPADSRLGQTRSHGPVSPRPDAKRWGDAAPETPAEAIDEAKRLVKRLLDTFPEMPDALELAARIRLWLGDSDGAVEVWQECLRRWPQYAYAYHGMGTIAAKKDRLDEAIDLFRKALKREPKLDEARRELAQALLDKGAAEEAIPILKQYVARNPQHAQGYVSLGFAYQQLGDSERAKQSYAAAIEREPNHARAIYGLATACARLGLTKEAQKYMARFRETSAAEGKSRRDERSTYDDVSALCEDLGRFYTDAGRIFFAQGRLAEAEMLCRRAAVLFPEQTECRQALALICRRQGRLCEAIEWLEELARSTANPEVYTIEIGRLQQEQGKWKEAEAAFRHARELAPENPDACASLARLLLGRKTGMDEAVALAERAVELRPAAQNYALLGTARLATGDRAGAIEAFQEAVKLAPEVPEFKRSLQSLTQSR